MTEDGSGRPRRPTMRDVAASARVSFKTVSRVVNGEGNVSPALVERVDRAVAELGYQLDSRASNLRSSGQTTRTIGFTQNDVQNPFFSGVFRGLEDVMQEAEYLVLAGSTDGLVTRQDALISAFIARRVDGLAIVPSGRHHELLQREVRRGTPVVSIDLDPGDLPVDIIMTDHREGARLAVQHLIAHGHRRIAFLGDDEQIYSAGQRLAGYRDALGDVGIQADPELILTTEQAPAARAMARQVLGLPEPPTALFTAQNLITLSVIEELHESGLQHQIALVGFDDVLLAGVIQPGITTVPQQPAELGRIAGKRLLRRMRGESPPPERILLPTAVLARGSGEILGPVGAGSN